ncbi:MAG: ATP-binding cassette domain-containing protein [Solirubrobacteraceae bacterium]
MRTRSLRKQDVGAPAAATSAVDRLHSRIGGQRPVVNWGVALAAVVVAALIPFITAGYILFQLELVLIYIGAASGLNLAVGYAGEFLLCQATVIGVAAYVAGIFSVLHNWSPIATLPVAIVAGIIWQLLISIAGLRVRGLYLGVLSFFSVLVFPDLVLLTSSITGGTGGLIGISPFALPGTSDATVLPFEIAVGVAVVSALIVRNLVVSGWGIRMRYLRDAPNSLASAGLNVATTKLTAYVVAAIPGAIAGWALAYFSESLTSSVFGVSLTLILFAGVQLIGPGTIIGPILGAGLLEGYSQLVGPFSQYNTLGLGILLTAALLLFPGGFSRILSRGRAGVSPRVPRRRGHDPEAADVKLDPAVIPAVNPLVELRRSRNLAAANPGDGPVLEAREIVKTFGGNRAVDGAGFAVQRGRIVALMGENGSGKTTLVNIISGFLKPDAGEVRINGRRTTGMAASQVARLGLARTFQVPQVVGELSVRENVEAGLLRRACVDPVRAILLPFWARRTDRTRREAALHICDEMGFSADQVDQPVDTLPLGLRRLVEVARAIASSAEVICLDEPAAGLNDEEIDALSAALKEVRQTGEAILLVEHNARFVLNTCDDIILLRAGQVEGFFTDIKQDALPPALQRHLRRATITT